MGQFAFLNENNVAGMSSDFKSNAAYSGEFAPIKLHYGSWKNNGSCSRRHVVGINCEEKRWLIIILILSS